MVSIVILTYNESIDLQKCLNSLDWCDDICLLDSGSIDDTLNIAKLNKVSILTNQFKSFGDQRNFALDNFKFKYPWVLFLDADERSTKEFHKSIITEIENAQDDVAGFYCCWKMILEDRWLKQCDNFPKWQFRLLKFNKARFTDFGHGQKEDCVVGEIKFIHEPYIHYGFSKGWHNWVEKHNRYSNKEAYERINYKYIFLNLFSKDRKKRNATIKVSVSKLPGWPLLRFIYSYFFKLGFLEGFQGLIYCINISYYEFLIQIKMRELSKAKKNEK
jgi:glycosyltransferase involved in cell wall biosynthesis